MQNALFTFHFECGATARNVYWLFPLPRGNLLASKFVTGRELLRGHARKGDASDRAKTNRTCTTLAVRQNAVAAPRTTRPAT